MRKFFIIGNGFSLAHKLPTRYSNFREYLTTVKPKIEYNSNFLYPRPVLMPNGYEHYDDKQVADFLIDVIDVAEPNGANWSCLEDSLAKIDVKKFLPENSIELNNNSEYDYNPFKYASVNKEAALEIAGAILMIKYFFIEWVRTFNFYDIKPLDKFKKLIDIDRDYFFNFNYTETLQKVYQIDDKNILHIHGKRNESLLFGHGSDFSYETYNEDGFVGSGENLVGMLNSLKKEVKINIQTHRKYFKNLPKYITKIYTYGFSFGNIDMPYINEILKNINNKNIVFYLNSFDAEEIRNRFKDKILSLGYKCGFDVF